MRSPCHGSGRWCGLAWRLRFLHRRREPSPSIVVPSLKSPGHTTSKRRRPATWRCRASRMAIGFVATGVTKDKKGQACVRLPILDFQSALTNQYSASKRPSGGSMWIGTRPEKIFSNPLIISGHVCTIQGAEPGEGWECGGAHGRGRSLKIRLCRKVAAR